MKVIPFEHNDTNMIFEYHITHEGNNYFMCYYKNSAVGKEDPKEAWRVLGVAKFLDVGKALKAWCLSMHEQYGHEAAPKQGRADTSFASDTEGDPTANTKMVT